MTISVDREICQWSCADDHIYIGELILNHNNIEFYSRNNQVGPSVFISQDAEFNFKVVTNGKGRNSNNRTLNQAFSHHVSYVLKQSTPHTKFSNIPNIIGFSFVLPELTKWLDLRSVEWIVLEDGTYAARDIGISEIVLQVEPIMVSLIYESSSYLETVINGNANELVFKNQPRINVRYLEEVNESRVFKDISNIMQFWGLLIGRVSDVDDIRLQFSNTDIPSWLYINRDFSYNQNSFVMIDFLRTSNNTFGKQQLQSLFKSWYEFCDDEKFSFIRIMFFGVNNRSEKFIEDVFIEYVRILEGYHLRISNDEEKASQVNDAIRKIQKKLKEIIFKEETKEFIAEALTEVVPEWTINSTHASDLSGWIAAGFLGRISLEDRLRALDQRFHGIISRNSQIAYDNYEVKTEESDAKEFFKSISCTRNYYAHYKNDKNNVLSFNQLSSTNNVLKALIIMIFLYHMNLDLEMIRIIMCWDPELNFETMCMRRKGEGRPAFLRTIVNI